MMHFVVHEWRMPLSELQQINLAQYYQLHATKAWSEGKMRSEEEISKPGDLQRYIAKLEAPTVRSK